MKQILLLFALAISFASVARAADRPPNIVLIFADDLGYNDVSFNGRKEWSTPNLDRLAKEGTVFRRFYTAAVVCAPSRAALLSGKYGIHTGACANSDPLPAEEVTIAETLKAHGYATGLFGKWHLGTKDGQHPLDQGFDEFFGFLSAKHAWEKFPKELVDGREMKPSEGYADTLFTDRGLDFIDRKKDQPFFLYLPYVASHARVEAPAKEIEKHKGKFPERDAAKPLNATYAAEITQLDEEVGRVVAKLRELKLDENTLVVFTSDHGATFEVLARGTAYDLDSNFPFRGQKRTLWEGGIRVPAIAWFPGKVKANVESEHPTHMTDLFPTLLAATGAAIDESTKVDGHNQFDVWSGNATAPQRTLFWEWRSDGNVQTAAMRGDMKLVVTGTNKPELFDVAKDPAERRSCAATEKETFQQLQKELDAWLATETPASKEKVVAAEKRQSGGTTAPAPGE